MKEYNRREALRYAKEWAYKRNPKYYNFDRVGGDCTSFVSQCIYAGAGIMNYSAYGWYYRSGNDKSASWSGVEYLHKFLINNKQKYHVCTFSAFSAAYFSHILATKPRS